MEFKGDLFKVEIEEVPFRNGKKGRLINILTEKDIDRFDEIVSFDPVYLDELIGLLGKCKDSFSMPGGN